MSYAGESLAHDIHAALGSIATIKIHSTIEAVGSKLQLGSCWQHLVGGKTTSMTLAPNLNIVLIGNVVVKIQRNAWIVIRIKLKCLKEIAHGWSLIENFGQNWSDEFCKRDLSLIGNLTVARSHSFYKLDLFWCSF